MDALCQALPAHCPQGAAPPADALQPLEGPLLVPAASAPPEDPLASACRYVGFQMEWVASKRMRASARRGLDRLAARLRARQAVATPSLGLGPLVAPRARPRGAAPGHGSRMPRAPAALGRAALCLVGLT